MACNPLILCLSFKDIKVLHVLCDKPFPQLDNLCKIFSNVRATSNMDIDLGEEDVVRETQRNSCVDVERLGDIMEETKQTVTPEILRGNC
uniref:Uncharacterized protein n=1 Tax=Lactuca sativa TaxID=4236 RepID=A0A9R1UXP7_LACSA|nr:hypothetical protein LSAT_V11C700369320 [Lactuca sativa]